MLFDPRLCFLYSTLPETERFQRCTVPSTRLAKAFTRAAFLALSGACGAQMPVPPPPPPPPALPLQQTDELPQPPPSAATFRIAGRVVDALDGRPLRHASVTISPNGSGLRAASREAETSDTGAFSLSGVPAGKYRLQGAARGYISAAYDEHEQYSSAIVTGAGVDTESLVLRLQPAGLLSGRVTDETGEPVRNANIAVYRQNTEQGSRRITMFRNVRADDTGAYEVTRLPPGTYYATVSAMPWYAVYPPNDPPNAGFNIVADVSPALNVVYPLTFYPEATDSSGAAPLVIKGGERLHADFHLTPQPAMQLTVQVPGNPNGMNGRAMPQLQQKVFDTVQMVMQQRTQMYGARVEIGGLPAGSYILREFGQGGVSGGSRSVSLTGGSVTVDATDLASFGTVTLVLGPATEKLPQNLRLTLRKDDAENNGAPGVIAPVKDGQAELASVEPGDYRVETLNAPRWHVDSISENGKSRPGALLHVTGEGQTATVTLGVGSVGMTGYVRQGGKGVSGAMVVLVPAGGDHSIELYRRDQSDLDGSFRFNAVLPGDYLLLAIHDGWSLEWGKPEVLAPYLLKAVPVTVVSGAKGPVRIEEGVPLQGQ